MGLVAEPPSFYVTPNSFLLVFAVLLTFLTSICCV